MALRLNGWHRLWIVGSVLYLVLVVAFVILSWPTAATTWHRADFITRLPVELQAQVDAAYDSESSWKNSLRETAKIPPPPDYKAAPMFRPGVKTKNAIALPPNFNLLSAPVSFPNGAILQILVAHKGDTEPDPRVGPAYWAVIEAEVRAARWAVARGSALAWLVPCLVVYTLGWAVAWVRRGFRGHGSGSDPRGPKGK